MFPSVAVRASTLSLDADSLGLALPVAFGCHGSRKNGEKWKYLARRCRNLTVQFCYLDSETAFVTVTGKGIGNRALSSFKHLDVDFEVEVLKGIGVGIGDAVTATQQSCLWLRL